MSADLKLTATEDLIEELALRHDAFLFMGFKDREKRMTSYRFRQGGNRFTLLGALPVIRQWILDGFNETTLEDEDP